MYTNNCTKMYNQFCCHIKTSSWQSGRIIFSQNFIFNIFNLIAPIGLSPIYGKGQKADLQASDSADNGLSYFSDEKPHTA
jgi:hypothetical protein